MEQKGNLRRKVADKVSTGKVRTNLGSLWMLWRHAKCAPCGHTATPSHARLSLALTASLSSRAAKMALLSNGHSLLASGCLSTLACVTRRWKGRHYRRYCVIFVILWFVCVEPVALGNNIGRHTGVTCSQSLRAAMESLSQAVCSKCCGHNKSGGRDCYVFVWDLTTHALAKVFKVGWTVSGCLLTA